MRITSPHQDFFITLFLLLPWNHSIALRNQNCFNLNFPTPQSSLFLSFFLFFFSLFSQWQQHQQQKTKNPHKAENSPPPPQQQQQQPPQSDDCSSSCWSLYDDLYYDTLYVPTESESPRLTESVSVRAGVDVASISACSKKRKLSRAWSSHLASGSWTLSREQGSKLLARKFRYDCLYVCEWPGCVHKEEKRKYCLFRGVFKNFRRTMVWRTIQDGKKRKMDLPCAFCACEFTWDLHSSFCLRPGFGFHDDGEPVVKSYVCENGPM